MVKKNKKSILGKKLYIHPMTRGGARFIAAVFRSTGVDAQVLPPSDSRTLELGSMYSAGDECLPQKVTLGDYIKITETEGFDPSRTAFLMPTAHGPCRFGQYWLLIENTLKKLGLEEIEIINPSSANGYEGVSEKGFIIYRTAWLGLLCADIIRKMLLKTRPYEIMKGITDQVYEQSLTRLEKILERKDVKFSKRFRLLIEELIFSRDKFRAIEADYRKEKPLVAVVGEIFCRHNRFSNENMLKKLEEYGAETWISDVGEWVLYTDWSRIENLKRLGKIYSKEMALTKLKQYIMHKDEHRLLYPFKDDFKGYEEPLTEELNRYSKPYLPIMGALGEMSISMGKSVYSYYKGVDGIVDISPFSCMNGIVSEAIYPSLSKDHNDIPCRVFYFDGVNVDMDRDIGIFMELVKGYSSRKEVERVYPDYFKD